MAKEEKYIVVTTTVDSVDKARLFACRIVEERLASCVQYTPVKSVYRWQGNVESADEYLLFAKTRADLADRLIAFIKKEHSYEVPEIVVTPIIGGLKDYLGWIREETRSC